MKKAEESRRESLGMLILFILYFTHLPSVFFRYLIHQNKSKFIPHTDPPDIQINIAVGGLRGACGGLGWPSCHTVGRGIDDDLKVIDIAAHGGCGPLSISYRSRVISETGAILTL